MSPVITIQWFLPRSRAKDLDDLTKTVFTLKGVQRSFTQVVLNTVKEDGRVVPPSE